MTTAAETLADFAIGMKYEDIPAEVIERAKDCVIDTVAACAFGAELPWTKTVIDYARRNSAPGECSVLGTPIKVRAPFACLANGAAAHAFELDALCEPSVGIHPSAVSWLQSSSFRGVPSGLSPSHLTGPLYPTTWATAVASSAIEMSFPAPTLIQLSLE